MSPTVPIVEALAALGGLHSPAEGQRLMDLATEVPREHAIVEIGSYTGVSALWMAYGAALGDEARVTCIDPWPQPHPNESDRDHAMRQATALERFRENMDEHFWPVTAIRARSTDVAPMWLQPVGLLFIDGDHSYRAVMADYVAWGPFVAPGGWLALHDYLGDEMEPTEVARLVEEVILPSGHWEPAGLTDKLWVAYRL